MQRMRERIRMMRDQSAAVSLFCAPPLVVFASMEALPEPLRIPEATANTCLPPEHLPVLKLIKFNPPPPSAQIHYKSSFSDHVRNDSCFALSLGDLLQARNYSSIWGPVTRDRRIESNSTVEERREEIVGGRNEQASERRMDTLFRERQTGKGLQRADGASSPLPLLDVGCVEDADKAEEREKGNSPLTGLCLFPLDEGFPPDVGDVRTETDTGAGGEDTDLTIGGIPGGVGGRRTKTRCRRRGVGRPPHADGIVLPEGREVRVDEDGERLGGGCGVGIRVVRIRVRCGSADGVSSRTQNGVQKYVDRRITRQCTERILSRSLHSKLMLQRKRERGAGRGTSVHKGWIMSGKTHFNELNRLGVLRALLEQAPLVLCGARGHRLGGRAAHRRLSKFFYLPVAVAACIHILLTLLRMKRGADSTQRIIPVF
ncbi:hypothetical protein B0H14DRAFT_3677466 [Mycena olivaceomarginata]|nr:hypothetical protein B0H14DRAFT_3677466 [Mycena olivaceomarginata]